VVFHLLVVLLWLKILIIVGLTTDSITFGTQSLHKDFEWGKLINVPYNTGSQSIWNWIKIVYSY
tara:strand:+ start:28561 stop:28752 length:192 start_codon:yes stop_codon:yes gene_type:complete